MKRWIMKPWTNADCGLFFLGIGIFGCILNVSDMDLFSAILLTVIIGCGLMLWVPDFFRRRGKKKQG